MRDKLLTQKALELFDKIKIGSSLTIETGGFSQDTFTILIYTEVDELLENIKAHSRSEMQVLFQESYTDPFESIFRYNPEDSYDFQSFEEDYLKIYYFKWVDTYDICYSLNYNSHRDFFKGYSKEVKDFNGTILKYEDMIFEIKYFSNDDIDKYLVQKVQKYFKKFNPEDYETFYNVKGDSIYYSIIIK